MKTIATMTTESLQEQMANLNQYVGLLTKELANQDLARKPDLHMASELVIQLNFQVAKLTTELSWARVEVDLG